jgi:hypothetical protein
MDKDGLVRIGQHDDVADIYVTSQNNCLHNRDDTGPKARDHLIGEQKLSGTHIRGEALLVFWKERARRAGAAALVKGE